MGSTNGNNNVDRERERERDRDLEIFCDLSVSNHKNNQNKSNTQFSSPVSSSFPYQNMNNANVCTVNSEEKDLLREEKKDLGGSMGPLLNGAWAYEH